MLPSCAGRQQRTRGAPRDRRQPARQHQPAGRALLDGQAGEVDVGEQRARRVGAAQRRIGERATDVTTGEPPRIDQQHRRRRRQSAAGQRTVDDDQIAGVGLGRAVMGRRLDLQPHAGVGGERLRDRQRRGAIADDGDVRRPRQPARLRDHDPGAVVDRQRVGPLQAQFDMLAGGRQQFDRCAGLGPDAGGKRQRRVARDVGDDVVNDGSGAAVGDGRDDLAGRRRADPAAGRRVADPLVGDRGARDRGSQLPRSRAQPRKRVLGRADHGQPIAGAGQQSGGNGDRRGQVGRRSAGAQSAEDRPGTGRRPAVDDRRRAVGLDDPDRRRRTGRPR